MFRNRSFPLSRILPLFLLAVWPAILSGCNGGGGGDGADLGPVEQIGVNLNFEPNNGIGCEGHPVQVPGQIPPPFVTFNPPPQSCMMITFFAGAQPATSGVAVRANIRVGNVTGPMRFVRARILAHRIRRVGGAEELERACCFVQEYGTVFTPTANAVTTVPLNFTMTSNSVPVEGDLTTIAAGDLVALELLAPGVPFPGIWPQNGGAITELPNYLHVPAPSAMGLAAPTGSLASGIIGYSGFQPSYNIDFRSSGGKGSLNSASITGF